MPFTSEEIQTAIEKLVASSIRRPYGALGTRMLDLPFADYQQSAAAVFMLHPKAPFYVLYLASLGVLQQVQVVATATEKLLQAVGACGRLVLPVEDLSPLSNAKAALQELEVAAYSRKGGFADVAKVPAYQRFKTNVEQFLAKVGAGVKLNGDVVMTPQEARASLPVLMRELKEACAELVRGVRRVAGGLGDMGRVNLPSLVAAGIIARAREVLGGHVDALSKLSPEERLVSLRQVVLELLAAKATVKKFGSLQGPSSYLTVNGTGTLFSDATHLATAAVALLDAPSPFGVHAGRNVVDLYLNNPAIAPKADDHGPVLPLSPSEATVTFTGTNLLQASAAPSDIVYIDSGLNAGKRWVVSVVLNATQLRVATTEIAQADADPSFQLFSPPTASITLSNSFIAEVKGQVDELYIFTNSPNNRKFMVLLTETTGETIVNATFNAGSANADSVAQQFNANVPPGVNIQAKGFFSILNYRGTANVASLGGTTARFTLPNASPAALGITTNHYVVVGGAGEVFDIVAVGADYVDAGGGAPPPTGIGLSIEVGRDRRVRIFCPNPGLALEKRAKITITDSDLTRPACTTLGFPFGAFSQTRPTPAKEAVTDINNKTTAATAHVHVEAYFTRHARTVPLAPTKVVFFRWRGAAEVTAVSGAGPYTVNVHIEEDVTSSIETSDVLVLRGQSAGDLDFLVVSATADGAGGTDLVVEGTTEAEVGPVALAEASPLFLVGFGDVVQISNGPNDGDYYVQAQGEIPIEVILQQTLPVVSVFNQPSLLGLCTVGNERVAVASPNRTTASHVFVREPAALLTTNKTGSGAMSTPWFKLPEVPQALDQGDLLELYRGAYNVPTVVHDIEEVERGARILQVAPDLTAELLSYSFSETIVPPFARLRAGRVIDFDAFTKKLEDWLLAAPGTTFFTDLTRLVNPLLVNKNPTAATVNNAKNKIIALAGLLTLAGATLAHTNADATLEAILGAYLVDPVHAVDTLLKSYAERGLDRAVDLLLSAQFTAFFNLTPDGASYTGNLMEKTRLVAQQDLPVSKLDRPEATESTVVNVAESEDFEYSTADTDEG